MTRSEDFTNVFLVKDWISSTAVYDITERARQFYDITRRELARDQTVISEGLFHASGSKLDVEGERGSCNWMNGKKTVSATNTTDGE